MTKTKFTFLSNYTELEATSVTIGSNVLYVTDGKSSGKGFATVDIGNSTALTLKSSLEGSGYSGYLDGNLVNNLIYTIDKGARLYILDSNNPIKPQLDSTSINYKDDAYSLSVVGNKVYVAAGASGFSIFDVSNYNISTIATYDAAEVKDVAVVGDVAYLASGEKGLQLVDVTKPNLVNKNDATTSSILKTLPVFSIIDTSGSATNVEVSGNVAYVADGYNGLVSIDVSSPYSPKLLGGYDTLGYANNVTISGNTAYISDYDKGVTVVDISNPSQITLIGTYQTLGLAVDTAVSNGVLYIAEGAKGVEVVKMTDVINPAGNDLPTGTVTISGKMAQGEILTASNTLDDVDGLGVISIQWLSNGQPITGATNNTYTLTQNEVGKNVSVKASYTDLENTIESVTSNSAELAAELVKESITNNTVEGTAGSDNLVGTNAKDYIVGKGGNDIIDGGAGDDIIEGGLGKDTLTGGVGNDTFVYKSPDEGYFDTITDFSVGDVIDFSAIKNIRFLDAEPSSTSRYDKLSPIAWSDSDGSYFYVYGETYARLHFSHPVFLEQTTPTSGIFKAVGGVDNTINQPPTGNVTIFGTPAQNETLIVSNTIADANGLGTLNYQWLSNDLAIGSATQTSYLLTQTDVGNAISVKASYMDGLNKFETVTSSSVTVLNVDDLPTGSVTISGTPTQGQVLTVSNSLADVDGLGVVSNQWLSNGVAISGANQTTYTLTTNDAGKNISVKASYIDLLGSSESVVSGATDLVSAPFIPVNHVPAVPVIDAIYTIISRTEAASPVFVTGTTEEWSTVSVVIGEAAAAEAKVDGTTWSYKIPANLIVDGELTISASATKNGYESHDVATQEITVDTITPEAPKLNKVAGDNVITDIEKLEGVMITGTAEVGSAVALTFGANNLVFSSSAMVATGLKGNWSYILSSGDFISGYGMESVFATAIDEAGNESDVTIVNFDIKKTANHAPNGNSVIDGSAVAGQLLTASNTLSDEDGLGVIKSQWLRNNLPIEGATQTTYTLTASDIGKEISIKNSYTDLQGTAESITSSVTDLIERAPPTYNLTADKTTLDEGSTITLNLVTTNLSKGTAVLFDFGGEISDEDVSGGLPTSQFILGANGKASLKLKFLKDKLTEGDEDLTLVLVDDSTKTLSIVVKDNSLTENKKLTGTTKADKLLGLDGNDTLIGGLGTDTLTGGKGADIFKFNNVKDSGITATTRDTITDFKHSESDKIDLSGIDADTSKAKDQAFSKPAIGAEFSGDFAKAGQLFFEISTHILYGNVNKDGAADFAIQLNGVTSLVAGDFIL